VKKKERKKKKKKKRKRKKEKEKNLSYPTNKIYSIEIKKYKKITGEEIESSKNNNPRMKKIKEIR